MDHIDIFKALSDSTRLKIVQYILKENCCSDALSKKLNISKPAISQHMTILKKANLISIEKRGYYHHYTLNKNALDFINQFLQQLKNIEKEECQYFHNGLCTLKNTKENKKMKIAVTYNNGEVFQHFGKTEEFKIYTIENDKVISSEVVSTNGQGHGALGDFLKNYHVDSLICGGIGGGARNILSESNITLYPGVSGSSDQVVEDLLNHQLVYNPETSCHHHGPHHKCHH